MDQVIYQQVPQIQMTDDDIFYSLVEKAQNDKLDQYIKEIEEEKEMRKFRDQRYVKLKEEIKKEKAKMLKEVKDLKLRMLKNLQEEAKDDDEDDFEEEKPKKKKIIKK